MLHSFIKQFYEMMAKKPWELHRFYKEESNFTHCEDQQVTTSLLPYFPVPSPIEHLLIMCVHVCVCDGSINAYFLRRLLSCRASKASRPT
jgi:hypothetical protein